MNVRFDRVGQLTTTTGTGTITLSGSVLGHQTFAALADGDTCRFVIEDLVNDEFEIAEGAYTATGTTLARTTVISSSNANAAVTFAAGTKQVYLVLTSSDAEVLGWPTVASVAVGTGAVLDFETGLDIGYDHEFTLRGVYPDVSDYLVSRVDEGAGYIATAAAYRSIGVTIDSGAVGKSAKEDKHMYLDRGNNIGATAAEASFGTVLFLDPANASERTRCLSNVSSATGATGLLRTLGIRANERVVTGAVIGIRFLWKGGNNFAGGVITHKRRKVV